MGNERTYRALDDNPPDIITRFDREFRHLYVSPSIARIASLDSEDFLGKTHRDLAFPEDECRRWENAIRKVFDSNRPFEGEIRLPNSNGGVTFSWWILPAIDVEGKVGSVTSIARSTNASPQANVSLSEDTGPILRVGCDGTILCANNSSKTLLAKWQCEQGGELPVPWRNRVVAALQSGKPSITRTGCGGKTYEIAIVPAPESASADLYSLEITGHMLAQDELRRQNRFLRGIFEAIDHPFCVIDVSDYSIVMANSATNPSASPEACPCYSLMHGRLEPCTGNHGLCPIQQIRETKEPVTVEHVHVNGDGKQRVLEIHAYPILDSSRKVTHVIEYSLDITKRRRVEDQLRRLSRKIIAAQELERKRIASELHDGVVQILSSINFRLGGLKEEAFEPARHREVLDNVEEYLQDSIIELRRISKDLRPDILDEMGLVAATENFCKEFEERTDIACEVDCSGVEERLSEETELVLYRIIQEALANVARHSGAKNARLSLSRQNGTITAAIQDDGRGFDQKATQNGYGMERHWGLINMRERAGFMGGTLEVKAAPGKGATIVARVPITTAGE
ncbi:PAS domain-containing protein [Verrucomicrobiota bacterium]